MNHNLKNILISILIIAIANFSIAALAWWTGTERSIINIDYFLPVLGLFFRKKIIYIVLFLIVYFFDFLMVFAQIFPFIRLEDIAYLLKFSFISSKSYQLYSVLLFVFVALEIWLIAKLFKEQQKASLLCAFNILIFLFAYEEYFRDYMPNGFWKPYGERVVYSQLLQYRDYTNKAFLETYDMEGEAFQKGKTQSATQDLFKKQKHDKVLLIVNESWGVPLDDNINQQMMKGIRENKNVINYQYKTLDFKGYTLAGELRELCQKAPIHFNLRDQQKGFEHCLPNIYKQRGIETVAVHGALSIMYDRVFWYPRAGFNTLMFRDMNLDLPESNCYSFPGNCDRDIAVRVAEQFEKNDKLFLYWLTLNTHSIFDLRDLEVDVFDCKEMGLSVRSAACRNLKLQAQFFDTLSNLIQKEEFKGTKVIVVGDHDPPIIASEDSTFFESQIPIIEFEIAK